MMREEWLGMEILKRGFGSKNNSHFNSTNLALLPPLQTGSEIAINSICRLLPTVSAQFLTLPGGIYHSVF